ncbi:MAG: DUF3616 domain-containing protein [Rhodoplanes sp.]
MLNLHEDHGDNLLLYRSCNLFYGCILKSDRADDWEAEMPLTIATLMRTVALGAVTAILAGSALAQNGVVWPVEGKLVGKIKNGEEKKAKDVSGIACMETSGFPRRCLIVDDDTQIAQFVTLNDGRIVAGKTIRLIKDEHNGKLVELDGEGVAYHCSDACYFYVIGSHGRPRHDSPQPDQAERAEIAARLAASSRVIRIKVDPATGAPEALQVSTKLKDLISADAALASNLERPLNEGGITIEGIAIFKGRLFAGFRGPSDIDGPSGKGAPILSAELGAFFDGKPADPKLHVLPLGEGQGVRDLAVYGDRVLILAGPTVGEGGQFAIYSWDGTCTGGLAPLKDLPSYGSESKPEALLPLDKSGTELRVLLLLDGEKEGGPRTEQIKIPDSVEPKRSDPNCGAT